MRTIRKTGKIERSCSKHHVSPGPIRIVVNSSVLFVIFFVPISHFFWSTSINTFGLPPKSPPGEQYGGGHLGSVCQSGFFPKPV